MRLAAHDLQHIVLPGLHQPGMDLGGPLGQLLHHGLLQLGGLGHFCVVDGLRDREMELVGGLDVGGLFPEGHKLRQIEELGEPGPRPVAGALGERFVKRFLRDCLN